MKFRLFTSFFFLILFSSFSQTGYLGKRTVVQYNILGNATLFFPSYNNIDLYEGELLNYSGINKLHEISLDYIITRNSSIGISVGYSRTSLLHGYNELHTTATTKDVGTYWTPEYETTYETDYGLLYSYKDLVMKLHTRRLQIQYSKYWSKSIGFAPLGWYTNYNLYFLSNKVEDTFIQDKNIHTFTNMGIGMEIGKKRVLFDLLILDLGISFKYTFESFKYSSAYQSALYMITGDPKYSLYREDEYNYVYDIEKENDDYSYSYNYEETELYDYSEETGPVAKYPVLMTEKNRLDRNAKRRLFGQYFFNIKLGIGFVL